jgi:hypothetical protein
MHFVTKKMQVLRIEEEEKLIRECLSFVSCDTGVEGKKYELVVSPLCDNSLNSYLFC